MKGCERTKGAWFGHGAAGRAARRKVEKRLRRIAKRQLDRAFQTVL